MSTPIKVSYGVLIATLIVVAWLHLGTLLLAAFFSYFALRKLHAVTKRKWLSLILFVICLVGIAYAAGYFTRAAWRALPDIADSSIPSATAWAEKRNIKLPFTDFETLKACLIAQVKDEIHYLNDVAHFAGAATTLFVLIVIGIVLSIGLPHAAVVIGVTFLCGLLPIIGNLISNTIILFLSAAMSVKIALAALVFLVALHKLEYFLNSKIIGGWTRNPVWLTLIGLIIGEIVMGIPGMILAPVGLNYVRVEMSKIEVPPAST